MLNSIFHVGTFEIWSVLTAYLTAIILGLVIAFIYRICASDSGFPVVLAVMPMLVTSVIMIVNGNLGASVAVLGAFGLVRFRSAPGTAMEIGFLFFAMAVGLATGMGFLTLSVIITFIAGIFFLILEKSGFGKVRSKFRQLKVTIPEDLDYDGIFDDIFQRYTTSAELERVKTTSMGTMYELMYIVKLRDERQQKAFIDELRCRNGNLTIAMGIVQKKKNEL